MRIRIGILILPALLSLGCNPYTRRGVAYDVEPVDPAHFPAAYLGTGGDPAMGGGVFTALAAYVGGATIEYYSFPFSGAQLTAADPLAVGTSFATPLAYVFDAAASSPYPTKQQCVPPANYAYDAQRDAIHYDQQDDVFTALPASSSYVPIVAEVSVASRGEGCQTIRSSDELVTSAKLTVQTKPAALPTSKPSGVPDGKYLAWAIIDPSAEVRHSDGKPETLTNPGPEKIGWYNGYFVEYLDGDYVATAPAADGTDSDLQTQVLYVPNTVPGTDAGGNPAPQPTMGAPGSGYDILQSKRGDAGYSAVCHVQVFTVAAGAAQPTSEADIDKTTLVDAPIPYIYCLQAE